MKNIDKALFILSNTNDGDDLTPEHLKLVEGAVNGNLTMLGFELFLELYQNFQNGYKKPWFHGIENLTIDHEGYVYWKGQHVEHYTLSWAFSDKAKQQAKELADRCLHLEKHNVPVSIRTAIWTWENYANL